MKERGAGQPERASSPSQSSPSSRPSSASQPAAEADSSRSITRTDLEGVIRRAAELSLMDSDAQDRLSEGDLVRIADELGLPAKHVWQALYERPSMTAPDILGGARFGSPIIVASRIVPGDATLTRRRLEDYLVTQEYLTIARRTTDELRMIPAEDTISSVARVFARPKRRHHIAHARRVLVASHALPDGDAAVRIEADLSADRTSQRTQSWVTGAVAGIITGGIAGVSVVGGLGGPVGEVAGLATFVAAGGATMFATVAAYGRAFRRKLGEARLEMDALLDRLETGERLEPPPAPWRRRLGLRIFGQR